MNEIIERVMGEYDRAINTYPPFNSLHEGYAVILEELDELWDEVKKKPINRDMEVIKREAAQVAAMALRFIHDIEATPKSNWHCNNCGLNEALNSGDGVYRP